MQFMSAIPASSYWAFGSALIVAVMLVLTKRWHGPLSLDLTVGVQKVHVHPTPRIGGVAIMAGLLAAWMVAKPERQLILGPLLLASQPAFLFGLLEDVTRRVSVLTRLLATVFSGVLGWMITGVSLSDVGVPGFDWLLSHTWFSVVFTGFAVGGVANALNIIDGMNGLASGNAIVALLGLTLINLVLGDYNLAFASFALAAAVLGFWLVNWPKGRLFLGDGGAYLVGFMLAWSCVLTVERNPSVSPFAMLLLCAYPVTEVLFSVFRRKKRMRDPGRPDHLHLHSLVMRRWMSRYFAKTAANAATGLVLTAFALIPAALAVLLHNERLLSLLATIMVVLLYLTMYARLVNFRWTSPLCFFSHKPALVPAHQHL